MCIRDSCWARPEGEVGEPRVLADVYLTRVAPRRRLSGILVPYRPIRRPRSRLRIPARSLLLVQSSVRQWVTAPANVALTAVLWAVLAAGVGGAAPGSVRAQPRPSSPASALTGAVSYT